MKKLLLIVGLSTFLSFNGIDYSSSQEASRLTKNSLGYEQVKVRLSENSKWNMITTENGWHIETFGKYVEVTPIIPNRKYSRFTVAFPDSSKLEQVAKKLDKNNDGTINLDELSDIY